MSTTETTQTDIEQAILALLPADGSLMAWRDIRPQIPGSYWGAVGALTSLHEKYVVTVVKDRGRNYVRLATDFDRLTAARERARLQAMHPLLGRSRNRDFAMA
ncbi:hypothetical protein [Mycobacteroides abscessus]|uniref:hypothetical protein n=1 Tax=Mycobacteroides abscessus TaxID=36809 RepID=UPI00078C378F|nr:hypothetical protein [Mycobacteroides abscessus]AMU45431.1 hypothetical protein A3O00_09445 [Mycobacteroides abscessus]MBN7336004.1 hypothetical protein [Mycobacteroides abscessus subsp. abscessus]MBN7432510.1 hypothetical protein [Mycobacteroides abscessus subsp. abscessus]MCA4715635.1 hypothetical protein [Mycobacteroides abscessus]MDM2099589.1 hypothetical protein [Mycobacteroides abscessus]